MKAKFEATNPEDILFTLNVTMTLKDWSHIRGQLGNDYTSSKITSPILDMTLQAQNTFYAEETE